MSEQKRHIAPQSFSNTQTAGDRRCRLCFRGKYDGQETARLQTLRQAAELGAPYIDVELAAADRFGHLEEPLPQNTVLILSHHNFEKTLSAQELRSVEAGMRAKGAAIAKIAMTAQDIGDSWTMLQLLQDRSGVGSC